MNSSSHYDALKIARDAPMEVIKAAYRAMQQKYHPDLNPGDARATENSAEINTAYETLIDPASRKAYDQKIADEEAVASGYQKSSKSTAAEVRQTKCYYCHSYVDSSNCVHKTVEQQSGRSSGSSWVGGSFGKSGKASQLRNWGFSGGRVYYRNIKVCVCLSCVQNQANARRRKRAIVIGLVSLLIAGWEFSELVQTLSPKGGAEFTSPTSVTAQPDPDVGTRGVNLPTLQARPDPVREDINSNPETGVQPQIHVPAIISSIDEKMGTSSAVLTIDETFKQRIEGECAGGFFCAQKIRWELCESHWHPDPPKGQSICRGESKK